MNGIFSFLDESGSNTMSAMAKVCQLKGGDPLFRIGEEAVAIYFVVSGRLAVKQKTGFGEKMQVVGLLERGAMVGEGCLIPEAVRSTAVVAVEPTELAKIEKGKILELFVSDPGLCLELYKRALQTSSLRLRENTIRLAHIL